MSASPPAALRVEGLSVGYGARQVVHDLTCDVARGRITAIVGANGCGKSTLLRTMARLLTPGAGAVLLDGAPVHGLPTREVARRLGFLPQSPAPPEGLTVRDLVGRGRFPHRRFGRRASAEDRRMVDWALGVTDTSDLAGEPLQSLSGGQRQRAWIAMTLAQGTPVLLLDEPTTYLDLGHQVEVLDLLVELNRADGRTIVMVLHDINLAARYADDMIAMRDGRLEAVGAPVDILTAEMIERVFSMRSRLIPDPEGGLPVVIPVGRTPGGVGKAGPAGEAPHRSTCARTRRAP